ncbi:anti-sigma factor [Clostridium sp.]|uniref:anti-sigma factor n=1 Tax=Clostridium sp. TaxID=1506 RepID=UPI002FCA547C
MSDDFKEKLKAYAEGTLSEEDKALMEKELEKLELYQEFLDEQSDFNYEKEPNFEEIMMLNQDKIIKKSKWKARLQNACIVLIIFNILFLISQTITSKYYNLGNPSKETLYRNTIKATIEATRPNTDAHGSTMRKGIFFSREIGIQYSKQVGKDEIDEGNLTVKFSFKNPEVITDKSPSTSNLDNYYFNAGAFSGEDMNFNSDSTMWNTLEKLPEGTVTEAHITFNKLYETDEVLNLFKGKDMELLWLAVDTGIQENSNTLLGFPHTEDFPTLRRNWFDPPPTVVKKYENGKFRNDYFIDTLKFLNEQKAIVRAINTEANLEGALDYINKNGVKIIGVTVTGPTKEILKLREENLVRLIRVGESRLWNWD